MRRIRLATRGSALALAQTHAVRDRLIGMVAALEVEIVMIRTAGDISTAPLSQSGGVGLFVKELEAALRRDEADAAVHSLKDLPTAQPDGLVLAAILEREDPRDVLVTRDGGGLAQLRAGSVVATASPRRRAMLKAARPDLTFVEVRGNVDTRLAKLRAGEFDVLVLALAGLKRLGLAGQVTEILEPSMMLPAPGQGAVAIEVRVGTPAVELIARLDHPATRAAVVAERAFLLGLGGGCSTPVGALGRVVDGRLVLAGAVADPVTGETARGERTGSVDAPIELGRQLAASIRERHPELVVRAVPPALPLAGRRVLVTRVEALSGDLRARLLGLGAEVLSVPVLTILPPADPDELLAAAAAIDDFAVVVLTSANAVEAFCAALEATGRSADSIDTRFAVIGPVSEQALVDRGFVADVVAEQASGAGLAEALASEVDAGDRVLFPRARDARRELPNGLRGRGVEVVEVEAYQTEVPAGLAPRLRQVLAAGIDAVVFASPSAVDNFMAAIDGDPRQLDGIAVACIGPTTGGAATAAGLLVAACPARPLMSDLVDDLVRALRR